MTKLLIAFVIFAGIIYYWNVDLIALVDKSGIPTWLEEKGYKVRAASSTTQQEVATTSTEATVLLTN